MTVFSSLPEPETRELPTAPNKNAKTIPRRIYSFLASAKLAMALLVSILTSCLIAVSLLGDDLAWALIFSTLWFNGLLVLLVVNVAFCFFGRIWGRKVTLVSVGMILFHLSFVAMLAGIIYNSLFYFRGGIRLTEGETLPSGQRQSYDFVESGRLFNYSWLRGETKLIKVLREYKIDGTDKRWAYEIEVGDAGLTKHGTIYITRSLDCNGFSYFTEKEGYSILTILYDKDGREIYGAYVPLQSLKQKDDTYIYTSGTKDGPGSFPFPQYPTKPQVYLQVAYRPSPLMEKAGDAVFQVWPFTETVGLQGVKPIAAGKAAIGERFKAGDYFFSVKEVRYWVGMRVNYEPGQPVVLTSLWVGLGGLVITFYGRLRRGGM